MTADAADDREWRNASALRAWAVDANDGVIATAGILEGFAGAGASDRVLITAAAMAMIAGALSLGGTKWAEASAEREAQLRIAERERAEIADHPDQELAELTAHYEAKGLDRQLAQLVAEQLSSRDALAAQLESEYGIDRVLTVGQTVAAGVGAAAAFLVGALFPFLLAVFAPALEVWAIVATVVVSLALLAVVTARAGHLSIGRAVTRSLVVGVGTALISYGVGLLLF